jgi:regulator of protease activity HflC (stomatin/prohibitin superfamily)
MKQDNFMRNVITIAVAFVLSLFVIDAIVGPIYRVWEQSQTGRAELARAESNRQIAVLEAQAKKDSAQQLAEAEVIRAQGVAKANSIIGESLKDNPAYLQYLWITEGEKDSNRTVYMIPSNGGAPVPTFDIQKTS